MNYNDYAPADPTYHSTNPSSPPAFVEPQQSSSLAIPLVRDGPHLQIPPLQIKLKRSPSGTFSSSTPRMDATLSFAPYPRIDEDGEAEEASVPFSGVDANAVRSQELNLADNTSETNAANDSDHDETYGEDGTPSKRERKARNKAAVTDSGSSSGKKEKKKGGKKGRKSKEEKGEKAVVEAVEEQPGQEPEEEEEYEVEKIIGHEIQAGKILYKVKWVNYGPEFDTFEPAEGLYATAGLRIEEYKRSLTVETREELEAAGKKKRKGRPSNASKAGKRPRSEVLDAPSDESDDEKDDDDDYGGGEKKKAPASTSRSRGPASKGALKMFASPKSTGPKKPAQFMENRQKWLSESDSNEGSDAESMDTVARRGGGGGGSKKRGGAAAAEREVVEPSPKPASRKEETGGGRKRRGGTVEQTPAASNGHAGRSSGRSGAGTAAVIEGMYRSSTGEVNVVMDNGDGPRTMAVRDAFDSAGWAVVQFLLDRCEFR